MFSRVNYQNSILQVMELTVFLSSLPSSVNNHNPVLLVFHGGGGTSLNAEKQFGFSQLADEYRFVAVYPQGMNNQWNDGRVAPSKAKHLMMYSCERHPLHLPEICPQADTSQVSVQAFQMGDFLLSI